MCLDKKLARRTFISRAESLEYLNDTHYIGYKVVSMNKRGNIGSAHGRTDKNFVKRISIDEIDYRLTHSEDYIISGENGMYAAGFHSMTSIVEAMRYAEEYFDGFKDVRIIKVYIPINSITAYGEQSGLNIMVSKKMTIPSQRPRSIKSGLQLKKII